MQELEQLLNLPYQTLAILVAGYLAYRLAFVGKDSTHTNIDTISIILVFSFVAQVFSTGAILSFQAIGWSLKDNTALSWLSYGITVLAVPVTLFTAVFWRTQGTRIVEKVLKIFKISPVDRHELAWQSIINGERSGPSNLTVYKKNGEVLHCSRLADFEKSPFGPCVFGQDGSIGMYVTKYKPKDSDDWEDSNPIDKDWGPEITVISSSEIEEIKIRHNPNSLK